MITKNVFNQRTFETSHMTFYEESDVAVGGEMCGRIKLADGWHKRRVGPTMCGKVLMPSKSPVGMFATIVRDYR
jgi:hypothetical protein